MHLPKVTTTYTPKLGRICFILIVDLASYTQLALEYLSGWTVAVVERLPYPELAKSYKVLKILGGQLFSPSVQRTVFFDCNLIFRQQSPLELFSLLSDASMVTFMHPVPGRTTIKEIKRARPASWTSAKASCPARRSRRWTTSSRCAPGILLACSSLAALLPVSLSSCPAHCLASSLACSLSCCPAHCALLPVLLAVLLAVLPLLLGILCWLLCGHKVTGSGTLRGRPGLTGGLTALAPRLVASRDSGRHRGNRLMVLLCMSREGPPAASSQQNRDVS